MAGVVSPRYLQVRVSVSELNVGEREGDGKEGGGGGEFIS